MNRIQIDAANQQAFSGAAGLFTTKDKTMASQNTPNVRKLALIGTYPPRRCGIATFTYDLRDALTKTSGVEGVVLAMNDTEAGYPYTKEVPFQVAAQEIDEYRAAADFLNFQNIDVVSLQHEFGIFGGESGSHIVALLQDLRMPTVTTLHTVLSEPNGAQRDVMKQLIRLSSRLVVMTERSKRKLIEVYSAPQEQIDVIPHGIPDCPIVDPAELKSQFHLQGKAVALTFGLLSPGKGIEYVLRAIPEIIKKFPEFVYLILGVTHPSLLREQGERYRIGLERLAKELQISKHVSFYNRFVELDELTDFIGAADLYVTPYLNREQAVSGTLAYAFGCGQAVISTRYWHAEELLADGRGVLIPFANSQAIAHEVCGLLSDEKRRSDMRDQARSIGRGMTWEKSSLQYLRSFELALAEQAERSSPLAVRTLDELPLALPQMHLSHLENLTDSTGILQHSVYTVANRNHGYCTDDNSRALLLMVLIEDMGRATPQVQGLASRYAAFLNHAYSAETGRFRNFMSYDRQWLDSNGSDDSQGRSLWALGACVGRSRLSGLISWAKELFQKSLPAIEKTDSPRAWASAVLGIQEYLRRISGDRLAATMSELLAGKLVDLYKSTSTPSWPWFEPIACYDNARLCQALIAHGRWACDTATLEIGVESLRWLVEKQISPEGRFRPIGSNGFSRNCGFHAVYDQQPIEAARWYLLPSMPTAQRMTRFGGIRLTWHLIGFWDAMIYVSQSTTPLPVGATMALWPIKSMEIKEVNRRLLFCCLSRSFENFRLVHS